MSKTLEFISIGNKSIVPDIGYTKNFVQIKNVFNSKNKHIIKIQDHLYTLEIYTQFNSDIEKIEDCYIESLDITFKTCKDLTEKLIEKFCHSGSDSWKYELKYSLNEVDNPNKLIKTFSNITNATVCKNIYILTFYK